MIENDLDSIVNFSFFNGYYKDIWRDALPPQMTEDENTFLSSYGNLNSRSKILDLMCGYGRHAIGLARMGINVTAIDNLDIYISEINSKKSNENLPLVCHNENVLNFQAAETFDMVICMGNSLCFFDESQLNCLFQIVSKHLKTGGKFIFNTWSIAEIAYMNFRNKYWYTYQNLKCLHELKYKHSPSRIEVDLYMICLNGHTETKKMTQYIYALDQIELFLSHNNLIMTEILSYPLNQKFTIGSDVAYIISEKK